MSPTRPERALSRRLTAAQQRGLSIIELMVGIVVSLLVGLAAAGSAMMFTASQRQGIGVGGVAVNASTALGAVKNDIASAGLGFFGESAYLCDKLNMSSGAAVLIDDATFVPVRITEVASNDRIDIVTATRIEAGANVVIPLPYDSGVDTKIELSSYLPVEVGQTVLVSPKDVGGTCVIRSVTKVTASTESSLQALEFDNTGSHNKEAFTAPALFGADSRATLIGDLIWHRYSMDNVARTLVMERPMLGDQTVLARNVMAFRAQYGVSALAGVETLGSWEDATGIDFGTLSALALPRVRAVRLGMVTRSPQREKPDGGGVCTATEALPQLFGEAITPDVADWQCYRYRTTTVVVPLRNLVYGLRKPA